jgi:transcriptional regulator with XRE-family HTH domain
MPATDYQNIGQYLKESRESLRVSLEEAASQLHIRAKYIRALEEGNLQEMPGKAYIRGYIRNYAHYLRLNVDEVLEAYGLLPGPKNHELFIPVPTSQQNLPTRWIIWLCLAALAVIYSFWYVSYHDRSELKNLISILPAKLAHLLDKPLPGVVDKAWEGCLQGDDAGCYVTVRARIIPTHSIYYELHQLNRLLSEPETESEPSGTNNEHAD